MELTDEIKSLEHNKEAPGVQNRKTKKGVSEAELNGEDIELNSMFVDKQNARERTQRSTYKH